MMGSEYFGNASVTGGHEIPGKNLITPDRRDIPVPPMLEAGLDLQQAPPIDSFFKGGHPYDFWMTFI